MAVPAAHQLLSSFLLFFLFFTTRVGQSQYTAAAGGGAQERHCATTPLFVFGASMMDVGEGAEALPHQFRTQFPPYGLDFFPNPANRFSNGRLIVDFINQGLGNGLGEDPYLMSIKPNFTCGANFAISSSTARNSSKGLFSLSVQVEQYRQLKENILYRSASEDTTLPSLQDFFDGIYLIECGHNDYEDFLDIFPDYNVEGNVSLTITAIEAALKRLHDSGAVNIVVMNVIPIGCSPVSLGTINPPIEAQDEYGCFAAFNDLVDLHNRRLDELLQRLSDELPFAHWTLLDANSIYKDALLHPKNYGIKYTRRACCGAGGEYNFRSSIRCGSSGYIDGVFTRAWRCDEPSAYIFWDELHPVESFARIIANGFLTGDYLTTFSRRTPK